MMVFMKKKRARRAARKLNVGQVRPSVPPPPIGTLVKARGFLAGFIGDVFGRNTSTEVGLVGSIPFDAVGVVVAINTVDRTARVAWSHASENNVLWVESRDIDVV
jgi:hypothetical protein